MPTGSFSATLTTKAFDPSRLPWFATCPCKPDAGALHFFLQWHLPSPTPLAAVHRMCVTRALFNPRRRSSASGRSGSGGAFRTRLPVCAISMSSSDTVYAHHPCHSVLAAGLAGLSKIQEDTAGTVSPMTGSEGRADEAHQTYIFLGTPVQGAGVAVTLLGIALVQCEGSARTAGVHRPRHATYIRVPASAELMLMLLRRPRKVRG